METNNPWLTIWTQPKATILRIVAENPNRGLWPLAWAYGFSSLMGMYQSMAMGSVMQTWGILLLGAVVAPIYGYINFSVWSWFVTWVGKLFKGQGQFKAVRAAYTWSCVPIVLNVPLWLLMVITFGHQLFLNMPDAQMLPEFKVFVLFAILVSKLILAIWSLVIYINALAAVQQFSIVKSILNIVVAGFIMMLILFVLWNFLFLAVGSGSGPAASIINT